MGGGEGARVVPAGGLGRDGAEARGAAHRAHRPVVHGRGQLQPVSRAHERERGREKFIIHFIKIHSERAIRNHSRYDAFLNQHGEQRAPTHGGTAGEADNVRAPAPSPRRAVARRTLCMHQCRSRECGVSAARPPPPPGRVRTLNAHTNPARGCPRETCVDLHAGVGVPTTPVGARARLANAHNPSPQHA